MDGLAFPPLGRELEAPGLSPLRCGPPPPPPALTRLFAAPGLSFCQLQKQQILLSSYINSTATSYLPQCQDSGAYAPVQCDVRREQCWCVDAEGMEVYGTRRLGRPARCKSRPPGTCQDQAGTQTEAGPPPGGWGGEAEGLAMAQRRQAPGEVVSPLIVPHREQQYSPAEG